MEDTDQELEKLRSIVEHRLGAFPPAVIVGVADIVLWILNSDDHLFNNKRIEIEKLLNPIADQVFDQMLHIAQHNITTTSTTHPIYNFGSEDARDSITAMEDIVAYNLLSRVYVQHIDDHRNKAFEMLSILKDESMESKEAQRMMIGNLLDQAYDEVNWDLFVFITSKLFPEFVRYWDDLAFNVIPAKDSQSGQSELDDPKVIDTLPIFTHMTEALINNSVYGGRFFEEKLKIIKMMRRIQNDSCLEVDVGVMSLGSGGFEESENELSSAGASASLAFQDRYLQLSPSRKGNGVCGGPKQSRDKDERPFSLVRFFKSIFRHE